MAVKIKPSDAVFSKCVRERTDYTCERCHKQYDRSSTGLHNSHYHGRANRSTRWDKVNCFSICYSCHIFLGANPYEHTQFVKSLIGDGAHELLLERKNSTILGKIFAKDDKAGLIAKHYRAELKALQQKRADGETGYIDFQGY
jgi:hypothetical protein